MATKDLIFLTLMPKKMKKRRDVWNEHINLARSLKTYKHNTGFTFYLNNVSDQITLLQQPNIHSTVNHTFRRSAPSTANDTLTRFQQPITHLHKSQSQ